SGGMSAVYAHESWTSSCGRQRSPEPRGGPAMPVYEYYCDNCRRALTVTLPIREHDKGVPACPQCGSTGLQPLVSTFLSQTAPKSQFTLAPWTRPAPWDGSASSKPSPSPASWGL